MPGIKLKRKKIKKSISQSLFTTQNASKTCQVAPEVDQKREPVTPPLEVAMEAAGMANISQSFSSKPISSETSQVDPEVDLKSAPVSSPIAVATKSVAAHGVTRSIASNAKTASSVQVSSVGYRDLGLVYDVLPLSESGCLVPAWSRRHTHSFLCNVLKLMRTSLLIFSKQKALVDLPI